MQNLIRHKFYWCHSKAGLYISLQLLYGRHNYNILTSNNVRTLAELNGSKPILTLCYNNRHRNSDSFYIICDILLKCVINDSRFTL